MPTIDYIELLIPRAQRFDENDIYTEEVRQFFITVANLVPDSFMGITVASEALQPLTSEYLKKIFETYHGRLTKTENLTRSFIASTYHLL